jgi:acetyl-CoA carboxylase biotin carboxyl carrier protein
MTDPAQLEAIRRLLKLVDAYGLAELVVEEGGLKVTIRGGETLNAAPSSLTPPTNMPAAINPADEERFPAVESPMTGVFYRSASPDAPSFVEPGDRVEEGQTIGLIEAMKVFSEIPADREGRVVRILATTGTLISQGDPLMLVDPEG